MKTGLSSAIAGCCLALFCSPGSAQETKVADAKPEVAKAVEGNNQFAFDLYRELSKKEGNVFFSPYSISNALAAVLAGARGETAKEMAKVLGASEGTEDYHTSFGRLNIEIGSATRDGKTRLVVANAFWRHKGLTLRAGFEESCARNYQVDFRQADFESDPGGSRQVINKWAEEKTNGKIKEVLNSDAITDKTRFVLANTVYFKGEWAYPFPKKWTKEEDFLVGFNDKLRVPMMHLALLTTYHSADGVQVVAIPYAGDRLSLVAFRARSEKGLRDFESRLSPSVVNDLLGKMEKHVVDVSMPRFRLEDHFALAETLGNLGMPKAFSDDADLSGIADRRERLRLRAVIHKTYLDVNEEGTEAAAVTAVVGVTPASSPKPIPLATIALDRPFFFLIRDNRRGAVLFLGRLANPRD